MFVARNFLESLALILDYALVIYMWLIIARAVLSWVNPDPRNPIVRFLYQVTEPLLSFLRRRLPLMAGGLDLSPLVVLAAILFLRHFLVQTLVDLARTLG
ncbi:MAG: YggT family protein [Deltaproteobacteria bacterium]|nr:YggT family protein [Deltaproteobacteria bacterium]